MTFHVTSLPHTKVSKEYSACAYTIKVFNFCKMMISLGHEVFLYAAEGSTAPCTELITIISTKEQQHFFGTVDWHKNTFPIKWEINQPYWKLMNERTANEINKRKHPKDFVCYIGGLCNKPLDEMIGSSTINVEPFIGYYGTFAKYRVFESYTHQSCVYGTQSTDPNGVMCDAVIPVYIDPEDFKLVKKKKDYLLYIGRLIQRKGILIAIKTAQVTGKKLILAGQGVSYQDKTKIITEENIIIPLDENVEYIGYADIKKRAELMGNASAVLMPTVFMEPGGNVSVEPQFCGTPVISTDFAVFSETIKHGVTGYRCHTLEQFKWAVEHVDALDPLEIRRIAETNYSLDKVKYMFQEYFQMLLSGGISLDYKRTDNMEWLVKV